MYGWEMLVHILTLNSHNLVSEEVPAYYTLLWVAYVSLGPRHPMAKVVIGCEISSLSVETTVLFSTYRPPNLSSLLTLAASVHSSIAAGSLPFEERRSRATLVPKYLEKRLSNIELLLSPAKSERQTSRTQHGQHEATAPPAPCMANTSNFDPPSS